MLTFFQISRLMNRYVAICNFSMVFISCDFSAVELGMLQVRVYPEMSLVWKQAEPIWYMQMCCVAPRSYNLCFDKSSPLGCRDLLIVTHAFEKENKLQKAVF